MKNNKKIFAAKDFKFEKKTYETDIGHDVTSIKDPTIVGKKYKNNLYLSIDYIEYDCGIKVDTFQKNENQIYCLVFPRSSISLKNLMLANSVGIIDPTYTDSIKLRFKYIYQPEDIEIVDNIFAIKINPEKIYKIGEKIAQIVFSEDKNIEITYVEHLSEYSRGGFGSTGK
jgi:dUTPase